MLIATLYATGPMIKIDHSKIIALYCDGGCIRANPSPYGGTWAWCSLDATGRRVGMACGIVPAPIIVRGREMSVGNNFMELMAAVSALESVPDGWAGTLYTDNELTIGRLTRSYALNNVTDDLIDRMGRVLRRLGAFRAVLLDGHPSKKHLAECKGKRGNPTSEHNKYCDWLCGELADAYMLGIGT